MKLRTLILPIMTAMSLVACQKPKVPDRAEIDTNKSTFEVGILQIETHPALDSARTAFKTAINNSELLQGKTIHYTELNAQGNLATEINQAKSLVASCDLMLGISTPSAQDLKSARNEAGSKQPILFTAVTDPVDAGLIKAFPHHDGSVTGTSDDNPVEAQIQLIRKCFPNKEPNQIKLGILYTGSETNSAVQAKRAQKAAKAEGITKVTISTCTSIMDLSSVANRVANDNDVIYIPTDNLIATNMATIKSAVDNYHTLCIVGEENMLSGGHITYSVSYELLGKRTGEMAALILSGTQKTHEIDAEKMLDDEYLNKVYNSANLTSSNITIPQETLEGFTDIA